MRASWGRSFRVYAENNVLATQLVLEACRETAVERVVYASSSSVYGDAVGLPHPGERSYQAAFALRPDQAEPPSTCAPSIARTTVSDQVSLRFFTVFGPRQRPDMAFHIFCRAAIESTPVRIFGDGNQTRDFTFVADIVEALVRASLAPPGSVMNIGGGSRVSLADVLEMIGEVTGTRPDLRVEARQAGDVQDTWADLSRARDLIDYGPAVGLREGLSAEYAWMRALRAGT